MEAKVERSVFIDCGGYDGCSAVAFLLENPHFDCVCFEPNPDLWPYYDQIPAALMKKAVYTHDGKVTLTLDTVDADGSTIIAGKRVDFTKQHDDSHFPTIEVPCADLSMYVRKAAEKYSHIVLKLDVEGAEYEILEKMLDDETLRLVDRLYCEFHADKMELAPQRHDDVRARVEEVCEILPWDALPFAVFNAKDSEDALKRRSVHIRSILGNRERLRAAERLSKILIRARRAPWGLFREKTSYELRRLLSRMPLLPDQLVDRFAKSAQRRRPTRDELVLSLDQVLKKYQEKRRAEDLAQVLASYREAAERAIDTIAKGHRSIGGPAVTNKHLCCVVDAVVALANAGSPVAQHLRDRLADALFPIASQRADQTGMRVAFIHSARMPTAAANNVSAMKMCAALQTAGTDVVLYAEQVPDFQGPGMDHLFGEFAVNESFPIRLIPSSGHGGTRMFHDLVAAALADGCTHIYTRSLEAALFAAIADVPVTLEEHKIKSSEKLPYLRFLAATPAFNRLVLISKALEQRYTELIPELVSRTLVLHDGADVAAQTVERFALHAMPNTQINVGYVGHLYAGKGVEICAELARRMPRVAFHVLGGTEEDIAPWREECSQFANIRFYGHQPHRMVSAFIQSVDICIAPFQRKVLAGGGKHNIADVFSPLKVFEYMAHGKAIVASDLPVLREVLEDGRTALLCNPDEPETFQNAINRLSGDAQLRETLGRAARQLLEERYTWKARAEHVRLLLEPSPSTVGPAVPEADSKAVGESRANPAMPVPQRPRVRWVTGSGKAANWAYGINAERLSTSIQSCEHETDETVSSKSPAIDIALAFDILAMSREEFSKCPARRKILRVGGPKPLRVFSDGDERKLTWALSQVDAIIALSPQLRDGLADRHPCVCFIPNGLDLEQFHPEKRQRENGAPFTVGMAASLRMEEQRQVKGYEIAKKACSIAGTEFLAIGRGKQHVPHDRMIEEFYSKIDVLVHPANAGKEGSSNVIMEALALGVPVVTTRHAGFHGQALRHGEEALVSRRTTAEFAAMITALKEDPSLRGRLARAGRRFAERHHCIKDVARRYEEVFFACLDRPPLSKPADRSFGSTRKPVSELAAKPDGKAKMRQKAFTALLSAAAKGQATQSDIEAVWANQAAGRASTAGGLCVDIVHRASQFGYFQWPKKVYMAGRCLKGVACGPRSACDETDLIAGKRVLDVGCGPGLHGLGFIALGATSYLGLDPSLMPNSDVVKNKLAPKLEGGFTPQEQFGWTPSEIDAMFPDITLLKGTFEELQEEDRLQGFDLITMHTVTEHLMNIESVFAGCADLLATGGVLVYLHHNFYGWNGHHMAPKNLAAIDPNNVEQQNYIDWNHLSFEPPDGHYFHRGLNRIRLDDLRAVTERFFNIIEWKETENDYGRLTDEILARHPEYSRRELATGKVFCIAQLRGLD